MLIPRLFYCDQDPILVLEDERLGQMHPQTRKHARFRPWLGCCLLFLLQDCVKDSLDIVYEPPVTFVGSITGDYDSLPGNRDWPNKCILKNDTVRLTFFSETFKEKDGIRSGNFIRIDILPCSTCVEGIETKHIRFHLARYLSTNFSYEITPEDTLIASESISMQIRSLERQSGGAIELDEIGATAKPLTGTLELDLRHGRIWGTVE